ncbi:S16 family serine protease, partial [Acidobacteriota bacterium]
KQLTEHGIKAGEITFSDPAILRMVNEYTREAGLRNLERQIANVIRKVAKRFAEGQRKKTKISPASLIKYLGNPRVYPDEMLKKDEIGVATGLAWTATGGEILFVESTTMKGKGGLILTGHLGEVMKESVHAALSFARTNADDLTIDDEIFARRDIHVHVPEGAIPKDGPSAGITMATAMISAFTGRPVRKQVAMTGEITLRGNVLPIGGVKEKILAAKRTKLNHIILPAMNRRDVEELSAKIRQDLTFSYVESMFEVLDLALKKPRRRRRVAS